MHRPGNAFPLLTLLAAFSLAACGGASHAIPSKSGAEGSGSGPASAAAMDALMPKSVSPGTIKGVPMRTQPKLPASAMLSLTPSRIRPLALGGLSWTFVPGAAEQIVASPDGTLWALSTAPAGAEKELWHYQYASWNNVPGDAAQVAVGPDGTLYAVNAPAQTAYAYYQGAWYTICGGVSYVTVAQDGSLYFLATAGVSGGNSPIWHYSGFTPPTFSNGTWTQVPGAGSFLAGSWDIANYTLSGVGTYTNGGFYVLNASAQIYYNSPGGGYIRFPGSAAQIAPGAAGFFVLSSPIPPSGASIYYYDLTNPGWTGQAGTAIGISAMLPELYVLSSNNGIWYTSVTQSSTVSTFAGTAGTSGSGTGTGSGAQFYDPQGLAPDAAGNLYIADTFNSVIRELTTGAVESTYAGNGTQGSFTSPTPAPKAEFDNPTGVAVDVNTNVFIADTQNDVIVKISAGTASVLAGTPTSVGNSDSPGALFNQPQGVAVDASDNVYVADTGNGLIRKITSGGTVATIAGNKTASGCVDNATGTSATFDHPSGILLYNSYLYVTDWMCQTVRKVSLTSPYAVTTIAGGAGQSGFIDGTGIAARFNAPGGIAVDASGNLYVADSLNSTIRKIWPSGLVQTLAGSAASSGHADGSGSAALFWNPYGITYNAHNGDLYVTDTPNQTVRQIVP